MAISDECIFLLYEFFSNLNCCVYGTKRLKKVYQVPKNGPSGMAWGTVWKKLTGLYFSANKLVTEDTYKRPLRYYSFPRLREDGAPPYLSLLGRQCLDPIYTNRWMRRAGLLSLHPHLSDLMPCDYVSRGYCTGVVYCKLRNAIQDLKTQITLTAANVDEDALKTFHKNVKIVYALYWEKGLVIQTSPKLKPTLPASNMRPWARRKNKNFQDYSC